MKKIEIELICDFREAKKERIGKVSQNHQGNNTNFKRRQISRSKGTVTVQHDE